MKTIFYILITLCIAKASFVHAKDIPPIEHFSKHQQFHDIVLSPNGKHIAAVITNDSGKRAVVIMDRSNNETKSTLSWTGNEMPLDVTWLNNERVGVKVGIKKGALDRPFGTGEVVAMNIDGSKKEIIFGYRKKLGRSERSTRAQMYITDIRHDDPKHITILTVPASGKGHARLQRLNIYTGKLKKIAKSPTKGGSLLADHNGKARFATGSTSKDGVNLSHLYYRKNTDSDWVKLETYDPDDGSMRPLAFTKDNKSVYVLSDVDTETKGVYLLNLESQKRTPVATHDLVDVEDLDFGTNSNLYAAHFEADYSSVKVLDHSHPIGKWYPAFVKSFSGSKVSITSSTLDMSEVVIRVTSDKDPGTFYLFNTVNQKLEVLMQAKPWLKKEMLASTEAFKFKSRDGKEIWGYLTLPKNKEANLPMIVLPHGGPHGPRDYWTYDDDAQFLATRGYAVLKVNFRGSGGYGREFQRSGYRQWGGDIMNDITDATHWAIGQGIADKERICIYGASFGGYASLMSVIKEPDLYKCALGYVGVYDMDVLHNTGDVSQRESGRNYLDRVIGHDSAELEAYSPARHVKKIKADLFIVHGEKDIRAHYDHALLLKDKLDEANIPYQWMTKPKEAHGFYNEKNRAELYEKMEKFFDKNIGH
jgi:dipeptidyl aminopeptidase/acylaminoacyl peptidase